MNSGSSVARRPGGGLSADRCGVGGRVFAEGGVNFANVPMVYDVAKGNAPKGKRPKEA